jgi:hypothetical protein
LGSYGTVGEPVGNGWLYPEVRSQESGDDDPIEAVVDKEQQLTEKLFEQFHGNLTLLRNWRTT